MFKFWKKKAFAGGLSAAAVSHVGRVRPNNEDNFLLGTFWNVHADSTCEISLTADGWLLAGIFDGMGGGEAGELASRAAAECLLNALPLVDSKERADAAIRRAIQEANNKILDLRQQYQIFGTTGTVLCTDGREFKIYHLGDSRAYLIRDGGLCRLTRDQTLAQMKLEMGMYGPEDTEEDADRHKLTEYIGRDKTRTSLRPQESDWMPLEGSGILLCSDGLYDMCTDARILQVWRAHTSPREIAGALRDAALEKGGKDNITAIVCTAAGL